MRSYDSVDYRYSSDEPEREKGFEVVANILGFRPPEEGLQYSLNFYAGGTGVDDRLAIRCRVDATSWPNLVTKLSLLPVATALSDPNWSEGFLGLVQGEGPGQNVDEDCCKFINSSKRDFQDAVDLHCEFLFSNESDVNTWCVVWICNGHLNYLSFDQG